MARAYSSDRRCRTGRGGRSRACECRRVGAGPDRPARTSRWTGRTPSDGTGVTVYLIDAGLDVDNSQFGGRATLGIDLTGTGVTDCSDEFGVGHGTFVAGIVGGTNTGVANRVNLVEVQALGCTEGGSTMTLKQERRAVVRAAGWIRRNAVRPAVVNMSLAFGRSASVDRAVRRLVRSGIPVVAAAGNQGENACRHSPARVSSVITVGASTQRDRVWSGSNQGRCVDIFAPGKGITSVLADGGVFHYRGVGATSWATPSRHRCGGSVPPAQSAGGPLGGAACGAPVGDRGGARRTGCGWPEPTVVRGCSLRRRLAWGSVR